MYRQWRISRRTITAHLREQLSDVYTTDAHKSAETELELESQVMGDVERVADYQWLKSSERFETSTNFSRLQKEFVYIASRSSSLKLDRVLLALRPLGSLCWPSSGNLCDEIIWRCFDDSKHQTFCSASAIRRTFLKGPSPLYALFNFDFDQVNRFLSALDILGAPLSHIPNGSTNLERTHRRSSLVRD